MNETKYLKTFWTILLFLIIKNGNSLTPDKNNETLFTNFFIKTRFINGINIFSRAIVSSLLIQHNLCHNTYNVYESVSKQMYKL